VTDLTRSSAQRTSRQTVAGPTVDVDYLSGLIIEAARRHSRTRQR